MKNRFEYYRDKAKLKQVTVAEKLGVNQSAISHWESGDTMPTAKLLPKIATLYGCTIDELLSDATTSGGAPQ